MVKVQSSKQYAQKSSSSVFFHIFLSIINSFQYLVQSWFILYSYRIYFLSTWLQCAVHRATSAKDWPTIYNWWGKQFTIGEEKYLWKIFTPTIFTIYEKYRHQSYLVTKRAHKDLSARDQKELKNGKKTSNTRKIIPNTGKILV